MKRNHQRGQRKHSEFLATTSPKRYVPREKWQDNYSGSERQRASTLRQAARNIVLIANADALAKLEGPAREAFITHLFDQEERNHAASKCLWDLIPPSGKLAPIRQEHGAAFCEHCK